MTLHRRSFLDSILAACVVPAFVRKAMKVRPLSSGILVPEWVGADDGTFIMHHKNNLIRLFSAGGVLLAEFPANMPPPARGGVIHLGGQGVVQETGEIDRIEGPGGLSMPADDVIWDNGKGVVTGQSVCVSGLKLVQS